MRLERPKRCSIPRHIRSPNWHRRARKRRSTARARFRLGLPLSARQALLVASHHATSPSFAQVIFSRMGKTRSKGQKSWEEGGDQRRWDAYGAKRWWSGAFKHKWDKSTPSPKAKAKARVFPSYDNDWKGQAGLAVVSETRHQGPAPGRPSLARVVQDAVNLLRKAEGKVAKLHTEVYEKARRWEAYQMEPRNSYTRSILLLSTGSSKRLQRPQRRKPMPETCWPELWREWLPGLLLRSRR